MIAHLESQCTNHVLRIGSTSAIEPEVKDMEGIREDVHAIRRAFQNASHNNTLLVNSFQEIAVQHKANVDFLAKMPVDVAQMIQVTREALSELERSSEGHSTQMEDFETCKKGLCAMLDDIKKAADELRSFETTHQQHIQEREDYTNKMQVLKDEIKKVSSMLDELKKNELHLRHARKKSYDLAQAVKMDVERALARAAAKGSRPGLRE